MAPQSAAAIRVLVAPLDWGLGHASRCIPVIRMLLEKKCDMHLAGSGDSLALLKREFPQCTSHTLPAYSPRYPDRGSMVWKMAAQLPKFILAILAEHRTIENLVKKHRFQMVISDNRYGCRSRNARSIFITHQSNILMPRRFGWLAPLVRMANGVLIRRFDECWIPDLPAEESLAGELISFGKVNVHRRIRFVGPLSRFGKPPEIPYRYDVLAICSGPEPQRSLLENILRKQLEEADVSFVLVRGVIEEGDAMTIGKGTIVNFLTSECLLQRIAETRLVVSRCGYSTVMDLYVTGRKAIFIPTPGQTEQEYLGRRLHERGVAFCADQKDFDLRHAIRESEKFSGFRVAPNRGDHLLGVINEHFPT